MQMQVFFLKLFEHLQRSIIAVGVNDNHFKWCRVVLLKDDGQVGLQLAGLIVHRENNAHGRKLPGVRFLPTGFPGHVGQSQVVQRTANSCHPSNCC